MFEMMVALKDAVTICNEEAQSLHPPILQHSNLNGENRNTRESHPYGMPLNYESVYEEYEEQGDMPMVSAANPNGQPEITQMPSASRMEKVIIDKVPSNTQPRVLPIHIGETSVMKNNINEGVQSMMFNADMTKNKLEILEESLRMIEGASVCEFGDAARLCLVPDVVIPPKFKVLEFEKYRGVTCRKSHLVMYCRKMTAHAHDEKLLMHFFQESLNGKTLNWYMHLESVKIQTWKDLVNAFIKQYKYNMDIAPNRMQLQSLFKRSTQTFKEYAQRWRELAA